MPISPENKSRYPKDWKLRSKFIRFYRARNHCEFCGVRNYSVGYRDDDGSFHTIFESPQDYKEARIIAGQLNDGWSQKHIVIVLTVAHLYDHRPEAANLLNLAALCQRCHLLYDQAMHIENSRQRRVALSGQIELI